jgi:archaellum component FlaF (FlaF/FlaG flagellin family)
VRSPLKSNLLLDRQYVEPESSVIGTVFVSNATPSGNTLVNEEALALIIIGRLVRQNANLSLVLWLDVFHVAVECLQMVTRESFMKDPSVLSGAYCW